jgi:hypothetical protein
MQVLRFFGYVFPMHSKGWSVATAEGMHRSANTAGAILPRLLCGLFSL